METFDILIVEDNDTMRMGIVETLRREKYRLNAFNNGVDALKKFKDNLPDYDA